MLWFQILFSVGSHVFQAIRIGRVHIQANDVFRTHAGVGEERQCVLPNLIVLGLETLWDSAILADTNLARREDPPGVWWNLDVMTVLRRRRSHGGRIARLKHE